MDLVDGQSVGIEYHPAERGSAGPISTLPIEFDWSAYLNFSQDEADSGLWTILVEEGKLPSFEDAIQDFECEDHPIERNHIEQSTQQRNSPTSLISSQSSFAAVNHCDHKLDYTAQNLNRPTNFISPDKSNTSNVVEVEEHHDPDGLAGLFGLTLEKADQGVRNSVKKGKQVEAIKTPGLRYPAGVQKPKSTMTKSVSIQRNNYYSGSLTRENFLAGLLEEELERLNDKGKPSEPSTGGHGHLTAHKTSAQTLHQDHQPLAQRDHQLVEQKEIPLAHQKYQTTEKVQSNQKAHHTQQFPPNQQYNALQRQTQSLLLARQHTLQGHCQSTSQMGVGYEADMYQPHLILAQQPYHQNWSNVHTHAHPQIQHTALYSHQHAHAPMNQNYSPPATQCASLPLQQMASSPCSRRAENPSRQQVFYPMPPPVVNRSSQMRAPGQQQTLLGHHSRISASPQQPAYNFSNPQFQTQPLPNLVAVPASHRVVHNAQTPQQRIRRPLNVQQQQWFRFYTQGHT